jgi:regulatory protein
MSRARLERIALHHLDRHPCSAARLRGVLDRRAARSRAEHGGDPAEHAEWIEAVIARLLDRGWLDDRAYATAVARSLRQRGGSRRLIAARLAERGVPADVGQSVLEQEGADDPDAERRAAAAYARRRGLGPHRTDPDERTARRERDLAALARAGFSYDIATDVLDTDPAETP